jgi:RimJ/RimL family protein N-acetyltransferase
MKLECRPLAGRVVRLEPLAEAHRAGLRAACEADREIWDIYPYSMAGEHFDPSWARIIANVARGQTLAYAVLRAGACVGLSCCFPDPDNRSVEIGGTYYRPDARGGPVNPDCKRLMLAHAFEAGAIRAQFKVDALNQRSRAAVLKLGAVQEGVLRRDRITWTGRPRDTVIFSILTEEWPAARARLDARLAAFDAPA